MREGTPYAEIPFLLVWLGTNRVGTIQTPTRVVENSKPLG
jgi:hypothetical protein